MNKAIPKKLELALVELYKSHYQAKEASNLLGIQYQKVAAIYRGLKVAGIRQYSRTSMIPRRVQQEILNTDQLPILTLSLFTKLTTV